MEDFTRGGVRSVLFGSQHLSHVAYEDAINLWLPPRALRRFWPEREVEILKARGRHRKDAGKRRKPSQYEMSVAKSGWLVRRRLRAITAQRGRPCHAVMARGEWRVAPALMRGPGRLFPPGAPPPPTARGR